MNTNYENDYNELKERQNVITQQIEKIETTECNAETFTNLIEKYLNITELNARILNELIEK